jgi:hypothetical protein
MNEAEHRFRLEFRRLGEQHMDAADDAEGLLSVPKDKRSATWQLEFAGLLAEAEAAALRRALVRIALSPPNHAHAVARRMLSYDPEPPFPRRAQK